MVGTYRDDNAWIDEYLDSLMHARFKSMDSATLTPFNECEFNPLYSREWLAWFDEIIIATEKQDADLKNLSEAMGPSALRAQLFFVLLDLKHARKNARERLRVANFFKNLLFVQAKEDAFVLHGKNVIHSPAQVSEILEKTRFQSPSPGLAKNLGRLYSSALHLANGLYSDIYTDYGVEVYGAYDASEKFGGKEKAILLVKDFYDLRQPDVWPQTCSMPCNQLRIYAVYKGIRFWTEIISCHFYYDGNPAQALTHWAVEADGKPVNEKGLAALNAVLETQAVEQWKRLTSLGFEEMKQKGLEQRCRGFKKLRETLKLDWRPSEAMRAAVKNKAFEPEKYFCVPEGEEEKRKYWRKLVDPRLDFYPK